MSERSGFSLRRSVPRLALVGLLGGVSAACSSDTMRFADNPFSNPFGSSARFEPQTTAAVPAQPTGAVQSQALPAPGQVSSAPLAPAPVASRPMVAAAPATMPSGPAIPQQKGWTAQGGSTVILAAGETIKTLSNRYGVPEAAIRGANGLGSGSQPAPGTRIVIPVYHAGDASQGGAAVAAAPAPAPVAVPAPKPQPKVAAAPPVSADGKALHRMQLVKGPQPAASASAKPVEPAKAQAVAARTAEPAKAQVVAAKPEKPAKPAAVAQVAPAPAAQPLAPAKGAKAAVQETAEAPAAAPAPARTAAAAQPAETAETTGSLPPKQAAEEGGAQFRWPARGRVIAGFGKAGGNDGINIALPEGTPVKAAEAGVVAYAGSELKGYGNLVLIRHSDGWVSAYAHNGELKVKRGDTVSRGQVVALSGQSGNVSSPQLHFELRKGSTPVDPMPHLAGL